MLIEAQAFYYTKKEDDYRLMSSDRYDDLIKFFRMDEEEAEFETVVLTDIALDPRNITFLSTTAWAGICQVTYCMEDILVLGTCEDLRKTINNELEKMNANKKTV